MAFGDEPGAFGDSPGAFGDEPLDDPQYVQLSETGGVGVTSSAGVTATPEKVARFAGWRLEVAWRQRMQGLFTLGSSLLGGTDVLPATRWSTQFTDEHDDITAYLSEDGCSWERGRSGIYGPMTAGTLTANLRDPEGHFNRHNTESPLYGSLDVQVPIRLSATWRGTVYPVFFGWITDIEHEPDGRAGTTTITAADLFSRMGGRGSARPVIASTGPTTHGAAIGAILDSMGWTEPAMRALDRGDDLADFSADGSLDALTLTEQVLLGELGAFYAAASGAATYRSRATLQRTPAVAAVANIMRAIAPGMSIDNVTNVQRVTRTGGVEQSARDDASVSRYGELEGDPIETPHMLDDNAALGRAEWIVALRKTPGGTLWTLDLQNREEDITHVMLTVDVTDRVAASEAETGTSGEFIVQHLSGRVGMGGLHHSVSYQLSEPGPPVFLVGVDALGGTAVLA